MHPIERRRGHRIEPKGSVNLDIQGHIQTGRIANLAEGGLFIITSTTVPMRFFARPVTLELRFDDANAWWIHCTGRIVRIRNDGVAVAFDSPPPAILRMVDELTVASRAHDRVISVVLIDADSIRRSAMVAGFRAAGCNVTEASTPLEAIVRLGEASFEPDVIAVADSLPVAAADEMRNFVTRAHSNAKLVTIGDELLEPDGIAHWLSSHDPERDLSRRVRNVLVRPRH
jgi:hypothetical protein